MKKFYYCGGCAARFEAEESLFEGTSAVCPACGATRPIGEFAVINFCPHCQSEIAIPLDVPPGTVLTCAECGSEIRTDSTARFDAAPKSDVPAAENQPEPETLYAKGDFFDKFEIIRLLGRGGMGEVYLAKHLLLDRVCALKILTENSTGDPIAAARFIQEAKLANRIDHPNLVRVFDTGADLKTGRLFIAMEFVDGRPLSQVLRYRRFSEADALMIGIEVCKVLEVMEANRIVHRDIKPSNIMIDHSGQVKLTDLGIAKSESRQNGEITLTRESVVFGTPEYASPEQCRSAHSADHRSDIYSLGATLFHLVSGEPPYSGESPLDVAAKVLKDPPRDLAALAPSLSAGFLQLIRDMMQRDPARRPAHASAVRVRMEALSGGRRSNLIAQLPKNLVQTPWLGKLRTSFVSSGKSITSAFGQVIRNPGWQNQSPLIALLPISCIIVAVYFLIAGEGGNTSKKNAPPESQPDPAAASQYNSSSRRISFPAAAPPQNTASLEPQPDPAAAAAKQEADMPPWLAKRLKHCRRMLAFPEVRNVPPRLAFFQAQQTLLGKQALNVLMAREAAKRKYSVANTRAVIACLSRIRNRRSNRISMAPDYPKLVELFKDPRTDPNMKLFQDESSCALAVFSRLDSVSSVLPVLLSRYPLVPKNLSSSDPLLIRYGIPGIRFDPGGDSGMLTLCLLAGMPPGKMPEDRIVRHSSRIRSFGLSHLHFAVLRGWENETAMLIAAGANVNLPDAEGQTALHYAYKYGRQDLVKILLAAGCDPDRKDKLGRTAMECAREQPLYRACFARDLARMQELVRTADADLLLENGYTALEWACAGEDPRPALLLLDRNADPMRIGAMHFADSRLSPVLNRMDFSSDLTQQQLQELELWLLVLRKFLSRPDGYVHIADCLEAVTVRLSQKPYDVRLEKLQREYRAIIEQTIQAIPDARTREAFQRQFRQAQQRASAPQRQAKTFLLGMVTEEDPDGCGIPHRIKERYGLLTSDPANVLDDLDGDGFSNLYEYKQNTLLDQPRSRPPLWHRLAVADIARLKLPLKLKAIMVQDPKDKFRWDVQINRLDSLQTEFTSLNRPVKIDGVDYRLKDIVVDTSEKDSGGNPIDKSYIDLESANGARLRMQIGKDVFTPDAKAVLLDIGTGQKYELSEKQTFRLGSIKTGRESYTVQSFDIQKQEVVLRYDSGRNKGKPVPEPITKNGKVPDSERVRGKNR